MKARRRKQQDKRKIKPKRREGKRRGKKDITKKEQGT
jgi:hypothetical protein